METIWHLLLSIFCLSTLCLSFAREDFARTSIDEAMSVDFMRKYFKAFKIPMLEKYEVPKHTIGSSQVGKNLLKYTPLNGFSRHRRLFQEVNPPLLATPPPPPLLATSPPPPSPEVLDSIAPIINCPDSYTISNVSIFLVGVSIPGISITPSSVLLLTEASKKRNHVKELPSLHNERQNQTWVRRLFQDPIMTPTPTTTPPTPVMTPTPITTPALAPIVTPNPITTPASTPIMTQTPITPPSSLPTWVPHLPTTSPELRVILQVDAGSLLLVLPGYLLGKAKHQSMAGLEWVSLETSSEPFEDVPGAGIQFQGTVADINIALATLQFGLGLGNGKSRVSSLTIIAYHMLLVDQSIIQQTIATKVIYLNITGAGAWFTIFQYTKRFYQSSVGVLCFFAMLLVVLCCILGGCICHDTKMEKLFDKNRTTLKNQNQVFNETRVFNPLWIPSAAVGLGAEKFVVFHNPKFLQSRQAEHLSSLHRPVVEQVKTITSFISSGSSDVEHQEQNNDEDGSDEVVSTPRRISPISTPISESSGRSQRSPSITNVTISSADSQSKHNIDAVFQRSASMSKATSSSGDSHSTHYTIRESRNIVSPPSTMNLSSNSSNSTHYDIGSSQSVSSPSHTSVNDEAQIHLE